MRDEPRPSFECIFPRISEHASANPDAVTRARLRLGIGIGIGID